MGPVGPMSAMGASGTRPPRVAFLAYRGNMMSGGQGVYIYNLTRELAELGWQIDLFVGPPYPDPMPWARVFQLENWEFWGSRFRKGRGAFLPRPDPLRIFSPPNFYEYPVSRFGFLPEPCAFSMRAAHALIEQARRGVRYHLVHDVQSVSYGLLWLRALGLPVLTTVHHPLTIDRRSSLQRDRTFKDRKGTLTFYPVRTQARVARHLDAVITSSDASAREIVAGFRVRPERIHQIGNGVELPAPGAPRPRPKRDGDGDGDGDELLFVGRCGDPNKGLEHLLDALALLPEAVRLRVLDVFPEGTSLEDRIHALRIGHRITFAGKVPKAELERAYASASAVVVPSLFEGFGLPAIEALAVGTPVVTTRAGALPEVIAAAGVGREVDAGDGPALAKGIAEVLDDWEAEHARALGARGRIEAAFAWPRVAERTARVYSEVCRPAS
jgi:glycosyltransferase involved in cell wall biosynthesis